MLVPNSKTLIILLATLGFSYLIQYSTMDITDKFNANAQLWSLSVISLILSLEFINFIVYNEFQKNWKKKIPSLTLRYLPFTLSCRYKICFRVLKISEFTDFSKLSDPLRNVKISKTLIYTENLPIVVLEVETRSRIVKSKINEIFIQVELGLKSMGVKYEYSIDINSSVKKRKRIELDPKLMVNINRIHRILLQTNFSLIHRTEVNFKEGDPISLQSQIIYNAADQKRLSSIKHLLMNSRAPPRSVVLSRKNECNFLRLPEITYLKSFPVLNLSFNPYDIEIDYEVGQILTSKEEIKLGIQKMDFNQGAVICGAIGTGKTTLRLHIMQLLRNKGVRIIDFDVKADAIKFDTLTSDSEIYQPFTNFYFNPFLIPEGFTPTDYSNYLIKTIKQSIPEHETLSPPQINVLSNAIRFTITNHGTIRDFFRNIILYAFAEKDILENNQDLTVQSLFVKLSWLRSTMKEILWKDADTLSSVSDKSSVFFDLSKANIFLSHTELRFLIDLIMARILSDTYLQNPSRNGLQTAIFIDEAQILLPKNYSSQLTLLEETLTTLRYKGISIIAAGVSMNLMSETLLDTGFVAQYRSEHNAFASLTINAKTQITNLQNYECWIKSQTYLNEVILGKISEFGDLNLTLSSVAKTNESIVNEFPTYELSLENLILADLEKGVHAQLWVSGKDRLKIENYVISRVEKISLGETSKVSVPQFLKICREVLETDFLTSINKLFEIRFFSQIIIIFWMHLAKKYVLSYHKNLTVNSRKKAAKEIFFEGIRQFRDSFDETTSQKWILNTTKSSI